MVTARRDVHGVQSGTGTGARKMASTRIAAKRTALLAGAIGLGLIATGCSGGSGSGGSDQTKGVTITVAWLNPPPPKAALAAFEKSSGITVKWADIDWSRVGQLGKLGWFYPMSKYLDVKSMAADMPQMSSFQADGTVYGIPFDSSYMVTTVNQAEFKKAGITSMPTTM